MDIRENTDLSANLYRHPWETARAEIVWSFLKGQVGRIKKDKITVLDIGSGDLYLARELIKKDSRLLVTALDIAYSPELIEEMSISGKSGNISMIQSLEEIPASERFSIVLFLDVLEHIQQTDAFLNSIVKSRLIDENTQFLITVPAWNYLFSGHDIFLGHHRRYSGRELKSLVNTAGIQVNSYTYLFHSLWLVRLLQFGVLRNRMKSGYEKSDLKPWTGKVWIAKLLHAFLLLDCIVLFLLSKMGIKLPGLTVCILGRKSG